MRGSMKSLVRPLVGERGFSTISEKIVASVLLERLPVVISKLDPVVYAFQEFSFRWRQQYRRKYPDDFLDMSKTRGKGDYQIDYVPAPRITEADKTKDRKSLQRALDRRLYLLLYGNSNGAPSRKPVWHFPEKVYDSEETLRKCAESALESVLGDLSHTYFVGNAPMGHMVIKQTENMPEPYKRFFFKSQLRKCAESALESVLGDLSHTYFVGNAPMGHMVIKQTENMPEPYKRFFFKSQVIDTNKFNIQKGEDFVWVTKDELLEYFPEQAEFFKMMIIS